MHSIPVVVASGSDGGWIGRGRGWEDWVRNPRRLAHSRRSLLEIGVRQLAQRPPSVAHVAAHSRWVSARILQPFARMPWRILMQFRSNDVDVYCFLDQGWEWLSGESGGCDARYGNSTAWSSAPCHQTLGILEETVSGENFCLFLERFV